MSNHEHETTLVGEEWLDALPDEHPHSPIGYTIAAQPQDDLELKNSSPMWAKYLAPIIAFGIVIFLFCGQINYP